MNIIDIFLHLDVHLQALIESLGQPVVYALLFLIIFLETGIVFFPFLPGDSLLFAIGAIAATGALDIWIVLALLLVAAIVGDSVNYSIGANIGLKVLTKSPFFKKEHYEKAQAFYHKHGKKTIILARFMPIIRTFAPFAAGVTKMDYKTFLTYNVIGAIFWVLIFLLSGFFFGSLPFVKHNIEYVLLAVIIISVLPAVYEFLKQKRSSSEKKKE